MQGEARFVGVEEARAKLGDLVRSIAAGEAPIILTRRGQPFAALVSLADFVRLGYSRTEA